MLINVRAIKAAGIVASTEATRFYLNGVCLEFGPHGVIAIATDGHRMVIARASEAGAEPMEPRQIIMPLAAVKQIKVGKGGDFGELTETAEGWLLTHSGQMIAFKPIDGLFPDWRRVLPTMPEEGAKPAHYDPKYVGDMGRVAEALGLSQSDAVIHHNGQDPAWVTFGETEDAIGVIMPRRTGATLARPSWLEG